MAEPLIIDPNAKDTLVKAAAEVEALNKEKRDLNDKFIKAVVRFTQLRFKTVKYFKNTSFNEVTKHYDFLMFISVITVDEKEIYFEFAGRVEGGMNYGRDHLAADSPEIAKWGTSTEAEYLEGRAKIMSVLQIKDDKVIITI